MLHEKKQDLLFLLNNNVLNVSSGKKKKKTSVHKMSSFGDPQCPCVWKSSWDVMFCFFFWKMCWQWLTDGKKREKCKHFLNSWSTEQTQLIQTLCLILSPSCLRFYVFKSSYKKKKNSSGDSNGSLFSNPFSVSFQICIFISERSFFKKGFNVRNRKGQKGRLQQSEQSSVFTSALPNL